MNNNSDYYPFGMLMPSRHASSPAYRYGFNGKEKDDEIKGSGNSYTFGARIYDPRTGRWLSTDPLEMRFAGVTTYRFALNNPLLYVDPAGETEYTFHVRSFIPEKSIALNFFRGDNRNFTTSLKVTSRVNHQFTLDTEKALLLNKRTWSDPTQFQYYPDGATIEIEEAAVPVSRYSDVYSATRGNDNFFSFNTSYSASDPLAPGAPDIDFSNYFFISESKEDGLLNVELNIKGDQFPAIESFVTDEAGNSVFIGVRGYEGSILDSYGVGDKDLVNANFSITLDDDGNFTGVTQGGETYSIEEWNKGFEQKDSTKDEGK